MPSLWSHVHYRYGLRQLSATTTDFAPQDVLLFLMCLLFFSWCWLLCFAFSCNLLLWTTFLIYQDLGIGSFAWNLAYVPLKEWSRLKRRRTHKFNCKWCHPSFPRFRLQVRYMKAPCPSPSVAKQTRTCQVSPFDPSRTTAIRFFLVVSRSVFQDRSFVLHRP